MPITVDAAAEYAKMGVKAPPAEKLTELGTQGQIPQGQPIPEGKVISQVVGRGQPAQIQVVPPQQPGDKPAPQIAIVPPTGSPRTSIGTFVEHSKTNPLTTPVTVAAQVAVEQPVPTANGEVKKKKLDLVMTVLDCIQEMGGDKSEEAQKFFDRGEDTLKSWFKIPSRIPLEALSKVLHRNPGIQVELAEQLEPHLAKHDGGLHSLPTRGKAGVVLCAPVLGQPTLPFYWTSLYLAKKYEMGFDIHSDTVIHRSRNALAKRFLESGAPWSLWLDSDMAAPIANADWFRWLTGSQNIPDEACKYDVLEKLLASGKAIVGGVYASRRYLGQLVIQPEIRPRSHEDKQLCNDIRKGTARGLVDVDWIGFGCSLVHREVFLEVQRRFPELHPETEFTGWRFFQPLGDEGEDEAFCKRVKACGIPIWLDTQLTIGHIGNMCFLPEHTRAIHAL